MAGTRWIPILRQCMAMLHREFKVSITPVPTPQKWVFVVGCYNSGTTLLSEMLGSHSEISALPSEGQYLTDQFPSDHEIGLSRMWSAREDIYRLTESDQGPDVVRLKKEWAMRLDTSKPALLEKTPANSARMLWLQKHFENSYFIAIVRNGYAVAEGITRKAQPIHSKSGWPIDMAINQWTRTYEVIEEDARMLDNFCLIKYEDLVTEPKQTMTNLFKFLQLDPDKFQSEQEWSIHERKEKISNLNASSIDRLSTDNLREINSAASAMLTHFNYPLLNADSR